MSRFLSSMHNLVYSLIRKNLTLPKGAASYSSLASGRHRKDENLKKLYEVFNAHESERIQFVNEFLGLDRDFIPFLGVNDTSRQPEYMITNIAIIKKNFPNISRDIGLLNVLKTRPSILSNKIGFMKDFNIPLTMDNLLKFLKFRPGRLTNYLNTEIPHKKDRLDLLIRLGVQPEFALRALEFSSTVPYYEDIFNIYMTWNNIEVRYKTCGVKSPTVYSKLYNLLKKELKLTDLQLNDFLSYWPLLCLEQVQEIIALETLNGYPIRTMIKAEPHILFRSCRSIQQIEALLNCLNIDMSICYYPYIYSCTPKLMMTKLVALLEITTLDDVKMTPYVSYYFKYSQPILINLKKMIQNGLVSNSYLPSLFMCHKLRSNDIINWKLNIKHFLKMKLKLTDQNLQGSMDFIWNPLYIHYSDVKKNYVLLKKLFTEEQINLGWEILLFPYDSVKRNFEMLLNKTVALKFHQEKDFNKLLQLLIYYVEKETRSHFHRA